MNASDLIRATWRGQQAVRATYRGQVVWSAPQANELEALLTEIALAATPRACVIPEPILLEQQRLWRISDATSAVTASGDPVGRADVVSSDSNDFLQPVSAARPQYRLTDGLHSLYGDGSQTRLVTESNVPWLTSSTAEAFYAVVFNRDSDASAGYITHCDLDQARIAQHSLSVLSNSEGIDRITIGGTSFSVPTTSTPVVMYVQFNKATREGVISWNGAEETPITVGTVSLTNAPMRILARGGGVSFKGNYYGQIAAEGIVPLATRRKIMQYLAGCAGVTL